MLMCGIWRGPVSFQSQPFGAFRTIKSSSEALDCLLTYWPAGHLEAYEDALVICRAAIEGRSSPELAKDAFIVAAYEVGFFMKLGYLN